MRFIVLACCVVLLLIPASYGQDQKVPSEPKSDREVKTFVLKITEVQLKPESKETLNSKDVIERWKTLEQEGKVALAETVTISAMEDQEVEVQFGKWTSIITSRSWGPGGPGGPARGTVGTIDRQVGTKVRTKLAARDSKIYVELFYEASRLIENPKSEIGQDDVLSTQIKMAMQLEPGKPTLASGSSAATGSYVIVSVE